MIAVEPNRIAMLQPAKGDICLNEDGQKFKVMVATNKGLFLDTYEGKGKATFFAFTGNLASPTEQG